MSLNVEIIPRRTYDTSYGFKRYSCKISGSVDGIDINNALPWQKGVFQVEIWHNGSCRLPALDQVPEIPYPKTYHKFCAEVKKAIEDQELISSLSPETGDAFKDLISIT
jgi:hypothetical protein